MTDDVMNGAPEGGAAEELGRQLEAVALEFKSGDPDAIASVSDMLADMRVELARQFETFAMLRDGASRRTGDDQPEAEGKQARSDIKTAVEGLSVIVRTLEKVDQLERQLARDRAEIEAAPQGQEAYEALLSQVSALIEARVEEALDARVEQRLRELGLTPALHAGAPPVEAITPADPRNAPSVDDAAA